MSANLDGYNTPRKSTLKSELEKKVEALEERVQEITELLQDNIEIFEGKTFQDLTKDIYENSQKKKLQIDLLIQEVHGMITNINDVVMVAPIIKEFMDVSVKNDEHLVKLAGVLQRILVKSTGATDETMLLSDSEKEDLMLTLQDTVHDLQNESDRLSQIKEKTIKQLDK